MRNGDVQIEKKFWCSVCGGFEQNDGIVVKTYNYNYFYICQMCAENLVRDVQNGLDEINELVHAKG